MSKASKKRFCPALNQNISAAECGEQRGSKYSCPDGCEFNPFRPSNYSAILLLDDAVNTKLTMFIGERYPKIHKEMERLFAKKDPLEGNAAFIWKAFFEKGADGLTPVEHWAKLQYPGLKNDERVMMEARRKTRIGLLEVQRVIDKEAFEAIDLLSDDPKPLQFRDESVCKRACRFSRFIGWVSPYPHYGRVVGAAINFPDIDVIPPRTIVEELVKKAGGPTDLPGLRSWLAEHLLIFKRALDATVMARTQAMIQSADAHKVKVVYELQVPFAQARDLLDSSEEIFHEELTPQEVNEGFSQARIWEMEDPTAKAGNSVLILGTVLLGQSHWRIETMGEQNMVGLKKKFEQLMGNTVKFAGQRVDDLRPKQEEIKDRHLIPEALMREATKLKMVQSRVQMPTAQGKIPEEIQRNLMDDYARAWLDDKLPALDGKTPRQAASDPQLRPKLIQLMKTRVRSHDERCLEEGHSSDINWMIEELGLQEINFPPPPFREVAAPQGGASDFPEGEFDPLEQIAPDYVEPNMELPLPPVPPIRSTKEWDAIVSKNLREFGKMDDAAEMLGSAGSNFLQIAYDIGYKHLSPITFTFALPVMIHCRFAIVPPGFREPEIDFERAMDRFENCCNEVYDIMHKLEGVQNIAANSRHPGLVILLAGLLLEISEAMPPNEARPGEFGYLMILVRTMIDELHETLQEAQ